jgi:hypothetical protein
VLTQGKEVKPSIRTPISQGRPSTRNGPFSGVVEIWTRFRPDRPLEESRIPISFFLEIYEMLEKFSAMPFQAPKPGEKCSRRRRSHVGIEAIAMLIDFSRVTDLRQSMRGNRGMLSVFASLFSGTAS